MYINIYILYIYTTYILLIDIYITDAMYMNSENSKTSDLLIPID